MIVFRQKVDVITSAHLGGGDKQPAMIAVEEGPFAERRRVDHGDGSSADLNTHRLDAGLDRGAPTTVCLLLARNDTPSRSHSE